MLNTTTVATVRAATAGQNPVPLTASGDERSAGAGLFTQPVDVSMLEELEVDAGRRSRWLPADVLL